MRRPQKIFIIFMLLLVGYWLLTKLVIPSVKNIFRPEPVVIDQTPILIKEIKSIGQLITYTSFDEVVADSIILTRGSAFVHAFNQFAPAPILPSADKQLVLIGKGKVLAGTNLALLTDTSISVDNDTIRLHLPKAQILDVILNPSDFETFVEKGNWSNEEVMLVKAKARRKIVAHALQQEILLKADSKAKAIMENFLHNMGYKQVMVL